MLEMEENFHHRNSAQNGSIEMQSVNDFGDNDSQEINPLVPLGEENSKDLAFDDGHGGPPPGSATSSQVVINIVISFVGAGLLGVPNAFMKSGWLLGSAALLVVSALNVYAMLRLPAVQVALQAKYPAEQLHTYGDVGRCVMGRTGEIVVQMCLAISQAGFGTAYIIFIAANIKSIAHVSRLYICLGCIPGLVLLVQFRDLKSLSPFSLLANTANFAALCSVLFQDYESYTPHNDTIHAIKWDGLWYVIAVTIYSMEGVGLILSLKGSSKNQQQFPKLFIGTITIISLFMAFFGAAGYVGFGNATDAPITLNMASNWSTMFVKLALCLGLYLTFPIMMFPIWNIFEGWNEKIFRDSTLGRVCSRSSVVLMAATIAYSFPHFGKFLGLVGSSICTMLAFIFPCYFHLEVLGSELSWLQYSLDVTILIGAVLFALKGTYESVIGMMNGEGGEEL
ncbi:unnamed protein product [Cylindrotheca closterium]|uniref:Amino acid transporter transmembrane domain-containing protein n=1 Tax=Cylindrotheca closterium TaxID=2856 RepID=A0AAD2PVH4_9STRA|nr:unnamed protein product [Cylindrotheca closterium]